MSLPRNLLRRFDLPENPKSWSSIGGGRREEDVDDVEGIGRCGDGTHHGMRWRKSVFREGACLV
jgi:hypothetical protein